MMTVTKAERIAAARKALAERYAADPDGVSRFEARMARFSELRRRERERVEAFADRPPAEVDLVRPEGMGKQAWKAERRRLLRDHEKAVDLWNRTRSSGKTVGPTREQAARADYVEQTVYDIVGGRSRKLGTAYGRRARFETMGDLSADQMSALRRYRRIFDASEISHTKSGLDVGPGGGSGGSDAAIARLETIAFSTIALDRIEGAIPAHLLPVLRAVALHDADFTAVAEQRFGSHSGQRRSRVKAQWTDAVEALTKLLCPSVAESPASEPVQVADIPSAVVHSAFINERGMMREPSEIVEIILSWAHEGTEPSPEVQS